MPDGVVLVHWVDGDAEWLWLNPTLRECWHAALAVRGLAVDLPPVQP